MKRTLSHILTSEGRVVHDADGDFSHHEYHMKDHLGNTRVVFTEDDGVIKNNDYYPFGMIIDFANEEPEIGSNDNKFLYNGKEFIKETDPRLGWYDYGARFYDPQLGRFTGIDPIAEKYAFVTPYNYAENEPIANIDLWGLQKYDAKTGKVALVTPTKQDNTRTPKSYEEQRMGLRKSKEYDQEGGIPQYSSNSTQSYELPTARFCEPGIDMSELTYSMDKNLGDLLILLTEKTSFVIINNEEDGGDGNNSEETEKTPKEIAKERLGDSTLYEYMGGGSDTEPDSFGIGLPKKSETERTISTKEHDTLSTLFKILKYDKETKENESE